MHQSVSVKRAARKAEIRFEVLGKRRHHRCSASQQDFLLIDNHRQDVCEHTALWVTKRGIAEIARAAVVEVCCCLSVQEFLAAAARQPHDNIGVFGRALWLLSVQCGCAG